MRLATGSQCKFCNTGVMQSNFRVADTRRAAAFWMDCSRLTQTGLGLEPPRGQIFMALALPLASRPTALASKVETLALRAALTIFWHHPQTHEMNNTLNLVRQQA